MANKSVDSIREFLKNYRDLAKVLSSRSTQSEDEPTMVEKDYVGTRVIPGGYLYDTELITDPKTESLHYQISPVNPMSNMYSTRAAQDDSSKMKIPISEETQKILSGKNIWDELPDLQDLSQPGSAAYDNTTGETYYTYKKGDTFSQVIKDLGLATNNGLWGSNGDVAYYTKQLREQGIPGVVPVGRTIRLKRRK